MNAVGHIVVGSACAVAVSHIMPVDSIAIMYMSTTIGSLLPDIDHPKSTLGRFNPFVKLMKHRGHAHSIIGILLLTSPFALISVQAFIFAFVGALSHIIVDRIKLW